MKHRIVGKIDTWIHEQLWMPRGLMLWLETLLSRLGEARGPRVRIDPDGVVILDDEHEER